MAPVSASWSAGSISAPTRSRIDAPAPMNRATPLAATESEDERKYPTDRS